jgi:hypothetical protein
LAFAQPITRSHAATTSSNSLSSSTNSGTAAANNATNSTLGGIDTTSDPITDMTRNYLPPLTILVREAKLWMPTPEPSGTLGRPRPIVVPRLSAGEIGRCRMDEQRSPSQARYDATRRSLHGVAELLLAGPQRRANRSIKLVVTARGFATGPLPAVPWRIAATATDLVVGTDNQRSIPLRGTFTELAAAIGVIAEPPVNSYKPASGCEVAYVIDIDPAAAHILLSALRLGHEACTALAAAYAPADPPAPVLWPEHFDVGITLDDVNYGVSPGDAAIPVPYAYVGPHTKRTGEFWNQPFGAARPMTELVDAAAVSAFFAEGHRRTTET